jgi:hypothetical protein
MKNSEFLLKKWIIFSKPPNTVPLEASPKSASPIKILSMSSPISKKRATKT